MFCNFEKADHKYTIHTCFVILGRWSSYMYVLWFWGSWWSHVGIVMLGKMVVLMKGCLESHIIHKSCHFAGKLSEKWKSLPLNSFPASKLSRPLDHLTNTKALIEPHGLSWPLLDSNRIVVTPYWHYYYLLFATIMDNGHPLNHFMEPHLMDSCQT